MRKEKNNKMTPNLEFLDQSKENKQKIFTITNNKAHVCKSPATEPFLTIRLSIGKEFHKYNRVVSIVSKPTENLFVQKFGCHK